MEGICDGMVLTALVPPCAANLRCGMGMVPDRAGETGKSKGLDDFFDAFGFDAVACRRDTVQVPDTRDDVRTTSALRKWGGGEDGGEHADTVAVSAATPSEQREHEREVETDALDVLKGSSVMQALLPLSHSPQDTAPAPLDQYRLSHCYYLHGLFEDSFLELLLRLAEELPGEHMSKSVVRI